MIDISYKEFEENFESVCEKVMKDDEQFKISLNEKKVIFMSFNRYSKLKEMLEKHKES